MNEVGRLQAENARLVALLEAHGIEWRLPAEPVPLLIPKAATARTMSTDAKVALFKGLFRGRTDVYPVRWESRSGKSGYVPACGNEWRPGICEKPRIKCGDCANRQLLPLTNEVVFRHLAGDLVIGVYPLLADDSCYFLAADFDEAQWRDDVQAFARACRELGVPVALEISRSGDGAHAWIFFEHSVPATDARRLGSAIISHACERTGQLALSSYDRLFPNQDYMPKGGFGNLIALPLQKRARASGHSVFVDDALEPYADQWDFLATLERMKPEEIEQVIGQATGQQDPVGVSLVEDDDDATPWRCASATTGKLTCPLPASVEITLANMLYFEKAGLPQPLANRLARLAAFQNPEFYKAQAMRMSVWNKPRVIGCAQNFPRHIALPRGCLDDVLSLLEKNAITPVLQDERSPGKAIEASFLGTLRADQQQAVDAMLEHDVGVLCAPTAFGKTVSAAALIARRKVNTLVLVHRTELLRQWQERLQAFLALEGGQVGTIGGGKAKAGGLIDIAVVQSLSRKGHISDVVQDYGQIIVDECHHLSAVSFEALLRSAPARYVMGLTATPVRRDGQHPIIHMQCGPIRHTAVRPTSAPHDLCVAPRWLSSVITETGSIQEVFRVLANDPQRTEKIAQEVLQAFSQGRKVLVLSERTEHVDKLRERLQERITSLFTLHGGFSRKQRMACLAELESLPADVPRVLLATGKLVGEGFDHPPLDTLILAMPISWKGILQQYAGRLHRSHADKADVKVIDFVDTGHKALLRMWEKRQIGYRAMGYRVEDGLSTMKLL